MTTTPITCRKYVATTILGTKSPRAWNGTVLRFGTRPVGLSTDIQRAAIRLALRANFLSSLGCLERFGADGRSLHAVPDGHAIA